MFLPSSSRMLLISILAGCHLFLLAQCANSSPSGGTSLYIPFNTSVAYLAPFNGLAGATSFTFEYWASSAGPTRGLTCILHVGIGKGTKFVDYVAIDPADVTNLMLDTNTLPSAPCLQTDAEWHHFAYGFEGTSKRIWLYKDGQIVWNYTTTANISSFPNGSSLVLGQEEDDYLSGFDPNQAWQGYIDEFRIWEHSRSVAQLDALASVSVSDDTVGLVARWSFDDVDNPSSAVSSNGQYTLLFGSTTSQLSTSGSSSSSSSPGCSTGDYPIRSSYVPSIWPVGSIPSFVVSYVPGSNVTLPIWTSSRPSSVSWSSAQIVSPYPSSGQILVGGAVTTNPPFDLPFTSTVAYQSTGDSSSFVSDAVQYSATPTGGSASSGIVRLRLNHRPVAQSMNIVDKQNNEKFMITLPVSDADGDPLVATITQIPLRGTLYQVQAGVKTVPITQNGTVVSHPGHVVLFVPERDQYGAPYATFRFKVSELAVYESSVTYEGSSEGVVSIRLVPITDLPVLTSSAQSQTIEGKAVKLNITAKVLNNNPISVVLSKLPQKGQLKVNGQPIVGIYPAMNETKQWASRLINCSTFYYSPDYSYPCTAVLGPPSASTYGDSTDAWSASTADGGCQSLDPDYFYTEYLHIGIATPVYVTQVLLYQNSCPGALTRIRAPRPDGSGWYTLWYAPAQPFAEQVYQIATPIICHTPFPTSELRLEFDTCTAIGWNEVDAIRIIGTVDARQGVFVLPSEVEYEPWALFHGPPQVSFTFGLTDCLGDVLRQTEGMDFTVGVTAVNDPPDTPPNLSVQNLIQDNAFPIVFNVTDVDSPLDDLRIVIVTLPTHGTLNADGYPLAVNSSVPASHEIMYTPVITSAYPSCGAQFQDQLEYQVFDGKLFSPTHAVVALTNLQCSRCPPPYLLQKNLCIPCPRGTTYSETPTGSVCQPESDSLGFPTWAIILIVVVGAFLLAACLIAALISRHYKKKNMVQEANNLAPRGEITMIFTDIQDSARWWALFPAVMPVALNIHWAIIEAAMQRYNGFEVSRAGDSVFAVFQKPKEALMFAIEVQNQMLKAEWPEEILRFESGQTGYASTGDLIWRGLRIRMGLHIGIPKIESNPQTNRADYLGHCVNLAARVSSKAVGGQILISDRFHVWLECSDVREDYILEDLGSQNLKGIPEPEHIYSLLPKELCGRSFPPILDLICNRCKGAVFCTRCDPEHMTFIDVPFKPQQHRHRRGSFPSSYNSSVVAGENGGVVAGRERKGFGDGQRPTSAHLHTPALTATSSARSP